MTSKEFKLCVSVLYNSIRSIQPKVVGFRIRLNSGEIIQFYNKGNVNRNDFFTFSDYRDEDPCYFSANIHNVEAKESQGYFIPISEISYISVIFPDEDTSKELDNNISW